MKNSSLLIIFFFFIGVGKLSAQTLSIQQLHEQVLQNQHIQQQVLQAQIAEANYKETLVKRFPVFYADANVQRNLIIPSTPVPAIAFDPTAPSGAILPLKFATKWSAKAGLQLEWQLFDPKRKYEETEQSLQVEKANLKKLESIQNWLHDATLAYASVVLATKQYEMARQDSVNYATILETVRTRFEEGREPHSSYLQAQQEMERKRMQLHEAWAVLLDADYELGLYVDLSSTKQLTSDITNIVSFIEPQQDEQYAYSLALIDERISQNQLKTLRSQLLPSLSMNAYLGEQYFGNQFKITQRDQWYGNSFVNLALRIPLSAYFVAPISLKKATLSLDQQRLRTAEIQKEDATKDKQKAAKVYAARQKVASMKQIEQLAQALSKEKEAEFKEGRVLLSDYHQSLAAVFRANQDLWQAEYDLIRAIIGK